ncbi:MAG: 3-hydroxyacyl-CoA dehydrogenase NAD-binding domain-containing protein [Woeseiaceae bacterium]|nr:3-hydroxyacyl-CoA dehydrogenase NAD-binding domain-containing protein [Woeseiaceae bacterium]
MSPVSTADHGEVTVITIDNPPVNALSQSVREGLLNGIVDAEAADNCKAIIIQCIGWTFIAGADIKEFGKPLLEPYLPDVVARIDACEKPVIAALHGTALGGGFEVALGCHYRISLSRGAVGLPEVNLGLLPGASGTQRLPRLVGAEKAMDMMLSGKSVKAPAALKVGAVDRIVDDNLLEEAVAYASECVEQGPRRTSTMDVPEVDTAIFDATRQKIAPRTRGLISPEKIISAVALSTKVSFEEGCAKERAFFVECMASPQSAGLRHAFFAERGVARVPGIGKDTPKRELNKVAVIGAGTMGAGIAYNCLTSGMDVILLDNNDACLERGNQTIRGLYKSGVERGKIAESAMADGLGRFSTSQDYTDLADVDIVIEAVFESMAVKREVFAALDKVLKPGAVLATNTSTLSIDEIAAATDRSQDVIGLHFFSPAHIMRLLEIVRGADTSDEVIATSLALARRLHKIGVVVGNCFGFVGNRMLYSYGRENQLLLLEGAAPEFIDKTFSDWGMAMGPNAVGDLAGLDVGYKVRQERTDLPDDPRFYRIADMLAEQARYGQKTGKGMYLYEDGSRKPTPDPEVQAMIDAEAERLGVEQRDISAEEIVERCIYGLVVEGARILEDKIAIRSGDIDVVWMNGYGFPRYRGGPMHYADSVGLDKVYEKVCEFEERFGSIYWEPPELLKKLAATNGKFSDL